MGSSSSCCSSSSSLTEVQLLRVLITIQRGVRRHTKREAARAAVRPAVARPLFCITAFVAATNRLLPHEALGATQRYFWLPAEALRATQKIKSQKSKVKSQ